MATIQLYPNQTGKVTYRFNGTIDGEPIIIAQGFACVATQDPKVESAAPDGNGKQTTVVFRIKCSQPQNIVPGDPSSPEQGGTWKIGTPCTATVDNPSTQTIEKIHEEFADTFEWVPMGAAKATAIGMTAEVE